METTIVTNKTPSTSNEVSQYAELIDKYGIGIVIAAAFIVISLGVMFIMLRSYLKSQRIIQQQQQAMFTAILDNMSSSKVQEQNEKKEHKELIDTFVKINGMIRSTLENLSMQVGADRTSVYVFHNGTNSSHGLPFIKTSCLSEVMRRGTLVARKISIHQNLPLSTFDKSVIHLVTIQQDYIEDSSTDERFPAINNLLTSSGVISAAFLALYDDENNMLGIMITEFTNKKTAEDLDRILSIMKTESTKIIPVLDYADYQQKN